VGHFFVSSSVVLDASVFEILCRKTDRQTDRGRNRIPPCDCLDNYGFIIADHFSGLGRAFVPVCL